jgi:hypothetical protein
MKIIEAQIQRRELELVIPPGATVPQQQSLNELISYGQTKRIRVRIIEVER